MDNWNNLQTFTTKPESLHKRISVVLFFFNETTNNTFLLISDHGLFIVNKKAISLKHWKTSFRWYTCTVNHVSWQYWTNLSFPFRIKKLLTTKHMQQETTNKCRSVQNTQQKWFEQWHSFFPITINTHFMIQLFKTIQQFLQSHSQCLYQRNMVWFPDQA